MKTGETLLENAENWRKLLEKPLQALEKSPKMPQNQQNQPVYVMKFSPVALACKEVIRELRNERMQRMFKELVNKHDQTSAIEIIPPTKLH